MTSDRPTRTILILSHILAAEEEPSVLGPQYKILNRLCESGTAGLISPPSKASVPEAALLGIRPDLVKLADGPLTVASLGINPPPKSVHFHLSLMSHDLVGGVSALHTEPRPEELEIIKVEAAKLNTKRLTFVAGEGRDHALVWEEGSIENLTHRPEEADGQPMLRVMPDGDGEVMLRRYIDDSVNLLSDLEFNRRRADEDMPPINLLWPWGQGYREPVTNMAIRRGEVANIWSQSSRLRGLSYLSSYRHAPIAGQTPFRTPWADIAKLATKGFPTIIGLDAGSVTDSEAGLEKLEWYLHQLESEFLVEHTNAMRKGDELILAFPGGNLGPSMPPTRASRYGLWFHMTRQKEPEKALPLREDTMSERIAERPLWEWIDGILSRNVD